ATPACTLFPYTTLFRSVVVGNVGMAGRREFLLGNVPNRISHNAQCTVIIVNTGSLADGEISKPRWALPDEEQTRLPQVEGRLLGRATHIGQVMAKEGLRKLFGGSKSKDGDRVQDRARRFRE